MKPFLPKEITLHFGILKSVPIDLPKAVLLLLAVWMLKDSPFPISLSVNQFRALVGAPGPHPDERGNANLLDPDVVLESDTTPSAEEIAAIKADLEKDNQGKLERGELQKEHPELYPDSKIIGGENDQETIWRGRWSR